MQVRLDSLDRLGRYGNVELRFEQRYQFPPTATRRNIDGPFAGARGETAPGRSISRWITPPSAPREAAS